MTDDTTPTDDAESTDEHADWLQATDGFRALADRLSERTVSLQTTDPEDDLGDLAPLAEPLRDARVVALGEATHGTREFFRLKHRLIRFLVERLDYRLVALEANFAETLAIDEYVVHGRGDAKDALEGTRFWTWNTQAVLALIEWLRAFNADRPLDDRVRFYGIDAQFTAGPAEALIEFLAERDPDWLDDHRDTLAMLADDGLSDHGDDETSGDDDDDSDDDDDDSDDDDDRDEEHASGDGGEDDGDAALTARFADADALVDALDDWFNDRRPAAIDVDGDELALHRRHRRTLEQAIHFHRHQYEDDDEAALRERDRAMAENLSWILDRDPRDRIVAWAHDEHVQRGSRNSWWGTGPAMGSHLADRYGDEYYAVGFDFADGKFQAIGPTDDGRGLRVCSLGPPPENAATRLFAAVGDPLWFVDFDEVTAADDRLAEWFDTERIVRSVGAIYDPDDEHDRLHDGYRLPRAFDGLLFVEETSRARPVDRD